jgi:hypothetical protein
MAAANIGQIQDALKNMGYENLQVIFSKGLKTQYNECFRSCSIHPLRHSHEPKLKNASPNQVVQIFSKGCMCINWRTGRWLVTLRMQGQYVRMFYFESSMSDPLLLLSAYVSSAEETFRSNSRQKITESILVFKASSMLQVVNCLIMCRPKTLEEASAWIQDNLDSSKQQIAGQTVRFSALGQYAQRFSKKQFITFTQKIRNSCVASCMSLTATP